MPALANAVRSAFPFRLIGLCLALLLAPNGPAAAQNQVAEVSWVDGDSGFLDGERFRLADVDAPETGEIGTRTGARCAAERDAGFAAATFMRALTAEGVVTIREDQGRDRYGRRVLDLAVDGRSVSAAGLASGALQPWPHQGPRPLAPKPDWCGA